MSHLIETEAFVAVAETGSFTAAGDKLGISGSYASKLVSRLETELGVRLIHRTTRKLALTEAGRLFHQRTAEALGQIEDAQRNIETLGQGLRGQLRISLPTNLGLVWLARPIANFVHQHADLSVDIVYLDRVVDLIAEGFDMAIRVGELPDSSLIVRRLVQADRILVASPSYLERHGRPQTPAELADHECLLYSYNHSPTSWRLRRGDERVEVSVRGRFVANSGASLVEAAACGLGVLYVPEFHVAAALDEGRVVRVLPDWAHAVPVQVVHPSARFVPNKVRALVDYLVDALREPPWTRAPGSEHVLGR